MEPIQHHHVFNGQHYPAWKIRIRKEIKFAQDCPLALLPLPDPVLETAAQRRTRLGQENETMGALARFKFKVPKLLINYLEDNFAKHCVVELALS